MTCPHTTSAHIYYIIRGAQCKLSMRGPRCRSRPSPTVSLPSRGIFCFSRCTSLGTVIFPRSVWTHTGAQGPTKQQVEHTPKDPNAPFMPPGAQGSSSTLVGTGKPAADNAHWWGGREAAGPGTHQAPRFLAPLAMQLHFANAKPSIKLRRISIRWLQRMSNLGIRGHA